MRRFLRELGFFLFFAALAVVYTWPVAAHLSTILPDLGDPILNAWILDWDAHALVTNPLRLYDAPMFYPGLLPLAYSENLVAIAVLTLPLHLAGVSPIAIVNIALLLGFALSGYGAFVLARMISRSTAGALVGGIFFAFAAYKFDHRSHLQIVFSAWVPLLLAALLTYWRAPAKRSGALFALAWIANGLTNIYFLMFSAVTAGFTIALLAMIAPRDRRFWLGLTAWMAIAFAVLLPFLLPYRMVSKHYHIVRNVEEVIPGSATVKDWITPAWSSALYGKSGYPERQLFPGFLILGLAALAIRLPTWGRQDCRPYTKIVIALSLVWAIVAITREELRIGALSMRGADIPLMIAFVTICACLLRGVRVEGYEKWAAGVWIFAGVIGSMGIHTFFYAFFYRRFAPFGAMRVPARWAVLAYAGLAVWGALGVDRIVRRRPIVGIALVALMAIEMVPRTKWEAVGNMPAPVYRWMAREQVGPTLELPLWQNGVEYEYVRRSMEHHQPIANGTSGVAPTEQWLLRRASDRGAYDELIALAERYGVRIVIVHGDNAARDWLRPMLASRRLVFLRRFDHGVAGDYVFAIARNDPQWQRLRAPELPDGAGYLPSQNLERFLRGEATYSDAMVAVVDEPAYDAVVTGPLRVRGWALSSQGLDRVRVRVEIGKHVYDANFVERDDIKRVYTWYYFTERPGFELTIPARPADVPVDTDLQIEIVDRAGRVVRTRDVLVHWE